MATLKEIIEKFPEDLKGPLYLYFDYLREEFEIKRKEFEELKNVVKELVIAQQKTEERLNELTERVNRLAIAQEKTEERLNELTERVNRLAIAQEKTEERVNRLAIVQEKTEERLNQLAIAQQKTEKELRNLTLVVKNIQREVGGLSHNIGYYLENEAYKALPKLLKERYGIEIEGRLIRKYVELPGGREEEINIYGKGRKNSKELYIIGEAKTNLTKRDIEKFKKKLNFLNLVISGEKVFIFVSHTVRPEVLKYAENNGFIVFLSYEF